jgi:hypothetical protein
MASLLTPAVALPILGVLAGLAVMFLAMRLKAVKTVSPTVGALPKLQSLLANPVLSHVATLIAQKAHDSSHAILDAAVIKMLPGLAPFVPVVNAAADQIDAKILGTQPPALPQPGDPTTRPIIDFLEAHLAHLKGKS